MWRRNVTRRLVGSGGSAIFARNEESIDTRDVRHHGILLKRARTFTHTWETWTVIFALLHCAQASASDTANAPKFTHNTWCMIVYLYIFTNNQVFMFMISTFVESPNSVKIRNRSRQTSCEPIGLASCEHGRYKYEEFYFDKSYPIT